MKILLITLATLISISSSHAAFQTLPGKVEKVLEVLYEKTTKATLVIKTDTFIPNIMGHACPVPAINFEKYHADDRKLAHNKISFGVNIFALEIKHPDMRFCDRPTATDIFGPDFKLGNKISFSITTKREILIIGHFDGNFHKLLVKTITSIPNTV